MTTKRRIPPDQRPALGAWDGPIYGQLGVLAIDDDKAQCHCCGLYFTYLANHVWRTHHLHADEYRAMFGLRMHTGLVGPGLRERHQQIGRRSFSPYWDRASELARAQTREQQVAWGHAKRVALESKLDPRTQAAWRENSARGRARIRELQAAGLRHPKGPPPENIQKALVRWRELMADPDYRARHAQKVSLAKGGRVQVPCATCGTPVAITRSRAAEGRRRFCSKDCFRAFLREFAPSVARRAARAVRLQPKVCPICGAAFEGVPRRLYCSPDCDRQADNRRRRDKTKRRLAERTDEERGARSARLSATLSQAGRRHLHVDYDETEQALRALPDAAFRQLQPREREMVRLYYGLADGVPHTLTEVGAVIGLKPPWACSLISRSVARLLGQSPKSIGP